MGSGVWVQVLEKITPPNYNGAKEGSVEWTEIHRAQIAVLKEGESRWIGELATGYPLGQHRERSDGSGDFRVRGSEGDRVQEEERDEEREEERQGQGRGGKTDEKTLSVIVE